MLKLIVAVYLIGRVIPFLFTEDIEKAGFRFLDGVAVIAIIFIITQL